MTAPTLTVPNLDVAVELVYRDDDGQHVAPGLAVVAATRGAVDGMWRTIPGRYTLAHVPSMSVLVGDRRTPNRALTWCAACIGEVVRLATSVDVDWARDAHVLKRDPDVRTVINLLHTCGSCTCGGAS